MFIADSYYIWYVVSVKPEPTGLNLNQFEKHHLVIYETYVLLQLNLKINNESQIDEIQLLGEDAADIQLV